MLWLLLGLSLAGGFLSLWIILPAPIFSLLPLSVGAPEISPFLLMANLIIAIVSFSIRNSLPGKLALAVSVVAFLLSAWIWVRIPMVHRQFHRAFTTTLGQGALQHLSQPTQQPFRQRPYSVLDALRGIRHRSVRIDREIPFATVDGVTLRLNVYRPETVGRYPGVIVIYGGAWQRGTPNQTDPISQYLAAQGYVVWAIDYRHAPQFRFPSQIEDIHTALSYIQTHAKTYETDLDRMAVMGHSAGGHLALLTAYQATPFPIRAVSAYYSPVDLFKGYYDLPNPDPINSRDVLDQLFGGDPKQFPDLYIQASPYRFADRPQPPTLLIYGKKDHIIESRYGKALHNQLRSHGNLSIFLEIPWADHAFDAVFNGVSSQLTIYHLERFLARFLQVRQAESVGVKD